MGYASKRGRRPAEFASKAAHGHIIKDPSVQAFLEKCSLPKLGQAVVIPPHAHLSLEPVKQNPIKHIIAIDGGYNEVAVQTEFPSATMCFFQFGALIFSVEDLESLNDQPFIDPDDMAKLKNIQRLKLALPMRNIVLTGEYSLTHSIRRALYTFFCQALDDTNLMASLKWFVFQEYATPLNQWILASCPHCRANRIPLQRQAITSDYTVPCAECGDPIFLTDVFRLHEAVDDELGAGGIAGYVTTLLEQMLLVHLINIILKTKPGLLRQIMFIKDGPLAFFGQTANMYKPMRALVNYLFDTYDLHLAGLEKSGSFVEHADEIGSKLDPDTILLLDNAYIYEYIIPGKPDDTRPYGSTTYYSNKLIFKTQHGSIYVVSLPTRDSLLAPKADDFRNLMAILTNVEKLKCDMYDNALMPVALANKLVSLSHHPSSKILQKFAIGSIQH